MKGSTCNIPLSNDEEKGDLNDGENGSLSHDDARGIIFCIVH